MPLVSGVCRAASAPMLSHGGSRLNASKPEANPKTSCPNPGIYIHSLVYNELSQKNHNFFVGGKKKYRNLTLFFISDSKQKLTVFLCSGQFELSLCWKKDTFLSFFPCYVWSLLQVKHYLQNKSFHINGIHFLFQKTQNTLQSNRLSRQKGLPTLSMARSTLKIHENFLFWTFWKIEYREKFCEDTKKNISVEKFLFLFGEKEWAKNIVEQKTTRIALYEYTEPSKEKTQSFCGQKKRQGSPLLFLHLYKTSFIFKRPPTNDRTCMGWHTRHASIHFGAGGTFTSRDAKPNGLESCFGTSSSFLFSFYTIYFYFE